MVGHCHLHFPYFHLALTDHQGWHDWHDLVQPERCPQDPPSPTLCFSASSSALSSPTRALPLVCRHHHGHQDHDDSNDFRRYVQKL